MERPFNIENPWAGISSYEDPEKVIREGRKPKRFCSREEESHALTQLIANNILVTLYGKSGTGKTSLLNAGVFPLLREKRYLPVSIRLATDAMDISFQRCVIEKIEQAIGKIDGQQQTVDVVPLGHDVAEPDFLWSYFARTRFSVTNPESHVNHVLFPVIAFDQFEEVLRDRRDEAEILLRQIAYLMDESHALSSRTVDNVPYQYDFNFRFVISIREDNLYRLEDSIDNNYLSELKRCRFRLRSLTEQGARGAILIPGEDFIEEDSKKAVTDRIINLARYAENSEIDTLLLSMVCAGTFEKKAGDKIVLADLNVWGDNPMETYYQDAIKGLAADKVRYIQQQLIREDGSRKQVDVEEVKKALGNKTYQTLLQGKNKLLSLGEHGKVELLHDQLGMAVYEESMNRKKKRILFQRLFTNGFLDSLALAFDLFVIVFLIASRLSIGIYNIYFIFSGVTLIFATYMLNVTRINHDKIVYAFIPPQILSSLFFYFLLNREDFELFAYHTLKPSILHHIFNVFIGLNVILSFISVFTCIYHRKEYKLIQARWKEYFSVKRKENRFAQISLLSSLILTICFLILIPDTHPEHLRKLAKKGDSNAMIELGNYYMKYDRDVLKAREWYNKAYSQGVDVSDYISNTTKPINAQLSDSMKVEATIALLSEYKLSNLDVVNKMIETDLINSNEWTILNYYSSRNEGEMVIKWESYFAQIYPHWKANLGNLGFEFWRGEYVEQDMERAFELYIKGKSHNNVVLCYLHGWGVERSTKKAKEYIATENCSNEIPFTTKCAIYLLSLFDPWSLFEL